jgi:hypothetical protein
MSGLERELVLAVCRPGLYLPLLPEATSVKMSPLRLFVVTGGLSRATWSASRLYALSPPPA